MSDSVRIDGWRASTDLYRFYDAQGVLLYVGISLSAVQRAAQHRVDKPWWGDVARMEVERHPDRDAALAAERVAIIAERPLHNVVHNGRPVSVATVAPAQDPPITWLCDVCGQPVLDAATNEEFGYIQVRVPRSSARGITDYWEVMHRRCDPNVDSTHYWYDVARVRTVAMLDDRDRHLQSKRWIRNTDWDDFMDHALSGVGPRHDRLRWAPNQRVMERRT